MPLEPKQSIVAPMKPTRPVLTPTIKPKKQIKPTMVIIVVLAILTLASAGAAVFYFMQYQDLAKNPTKLVDDENKALVAKVGSLMVLPSGETPTIATITDLAPFKDQPFFANAKIGYKVIIYTNAKRAILYDPTANKIVEVAPLNIGANQPAETNTNSNANTNTP